MSIQPPNPELAALPNLFLLDLENRAVIDGKVPQATLNIALLAFAVVLSLLALGGILHNAGQWSIYFQLKQAGLTTSALVTDQRIEPTCIGVCVNRYFLTYSYTVDGKTHSATAEVDEGTYFGIFLGLTTVVYLPDNPTISRIAGSALDAAMLPVAVLTLVMVVGAVLALAGSAVHIVSTRRARSRGRLLRGEILEWQVHDIQNGNKPPAVRLELRYGFDAPEGRRLEHIQTMKMSAGKYRGSYFPDAGTPVAVRYVNDQQHEVL